MPLPPGQIRARTSSAASSTSRVRSWRNATSSRAPS